MVTSKTFYGYKHWTLENEPRCFYVGKGRKCRPHQTDRRNHKWLAISKRLGLRVEICYVTESNDDVCAWEIREIEREKTFTTSHAHDDLTDIGCNFTRGGDVGGLGTKRTPEQRAKISAALKGKPSHKQTEDAKRRIGEASRNRVRSAETKERNRKAASLESLSDETRQKRSEAASKRTVQCDDSWNVVNVFASSRDAVTSVSGSPGKLSQAIKLQRKYKGFYWRFDDSVTSLGT